MLSIIIGILGALLGVYLREALREAYHRKKIMARLEAHIAYWIRRASEDKRIEQAAKSILLLVETKKEVYKKGGKDAFLKALKVQKEKLDDIENVIDLKRDTLLEMIKEFKSLNDVAYNFILESINDARSSVIDNKMFISEQEAGVLPYPIVGTVVEVRSRICSFFDNIKYLIELSRANENDNFDMIKHFYIDMIKNLIILSENLFSLRDLAEKYQKKSLLKVLLDWR